MKTVTIELPAVTPLESVTLAFTETLNRKIESSIETLKKLNVPERIEINVEAFVKLESPVPVKLYGVVLNIDKEGMYTLEVEAWDEIIESEPLKYEA